ncbi:MAG: hypothetical protein ACREDF_01940 [Thermoplasmata archaeon]
MSYHGIQLSGIGLLLYALFAFAASGYLRESADWAGGIGLVVVLIGAWLDPFSGAAPNRSSLNRGAPARLT